MEDEYRSGLLVVFQPTLGPKSLQPIPIDLVVDEVPLERAELVAPADRVDVEGLQICDYLVYPVENALADKLCALVERHDRRASSRVKDLVDIAIYAATCPIDGGKLREHVLREGAVRGIVLPEAFGIPDEWGAPHARQFEKLCSQTGLPHSSEHWRVSRTREQTFRSRAYRFCRWHDLESGNVRMGIDIYVLKWALLDILLAVG